MIEFLHFTAVAAAVCVLVILLIVIIWRWGCCKTQKRFVDSTNGTDSLKIGIQRLHQEILNHEFDLGTKRNGNYYVFRRGVSEKMLFNWNDHPSLITEAVENGWSRFGFTFTGYVSSPSTRTLLGLCAVAGGGDGGKGEAEISWEVCAGSADFMQKIRLNSGLKKGNLNSNSLGVSSVIRTGLPLPGPPLGNSSFPQEAYFEITVLSSSGRGGDCHEFGEKIKEGERIKLIQESNGKVNSESLVDELKNGGKDGGRGEMVVLSIGLTGGDSLPLKLPGSFPGSIGFNSSGSVYLDGMKLVFEDEKAEWGRREKVIGCGFDPIHKKVFFTVDSELVHVIHCKSDEFGTPLYPTLAANTDTLVLINFGQSAFKYSPANAQRTPNPCFIRPLGNSPAAALNYEDSKELFSMGRIDSQWHNHGANRGSSHNEGSNNRDEEFDEESEADLFEIVLDNGRSSNAVTYYHR